MIFVPQAKVRSFYHSASNARILTLLPVAKGTDKSCQHLLGETVADLGAVLGGKRAMEDCVATG